LRAGPRIVGQRAVRPDAVRAGATTAPESCTPPLATPAALSLASRQTLTTALATALSQRRALAASAPGVLIECPHLLALGHALSGRHAVRVGGVAQAFLHVADAGLVTLDDHDGHPSVRSLVEQGYEVITF